MRAGFLEQARWQSVGNGKNTEGRRKDLEAGEGWAQREQRIVTGESGDCQQRSVA